MGRILALRTMGTILLLGITPPKRDFLKSGSQSTSEQVTRAVLNNLPTAKEFLNVRNNAASPVSSVDETVKAISNRSGLTSDNRVRIATAALGILLTVAVKEGPRLVKIINRGRKPA